MLKPDIHNIARKFIDNREPKHQRQIITKILALCRDPQPPDSQQLKGANRGERRATIGDYRIIYWTDETTLHVTTIGKRNDARVYRRRSS